MLNVELKDTVGAVVYTDGGCSGNPGKMGWGVHGYIYDTTPIDKALLADGWQITTEGYKPIPHPSQPFIYVNPKTYIDGFGCMTHDGTNNQAELYAVINALTKLKEFKPVSIQVYTDSEYVKRGITEWLNNWVKRNFIKADGSVVPNSPLWLELHNLIQEYRNHNVDINIGWVKGHNNILGNVEADILATIGVSHSIEGRQSNIFTISDAKDYWKSNNERHPYLNFRRIYFNSTEIFNVPGQYYQGDPGGEDFIIGKRMPETGFSVVRLTEPEHCVESVRNRQFKLNKDMNAIFMMKLDKVYDKKVHRYITNYGPHSLSKSRKNFNLVFTDNSVVTSELNPTGLSLRAIESFNFLEEILDKFIIYRQDEQAKAKDAFKLDFIDITPLFFESNIKLVRKEQVHTLNLRSEFNVGFRDYKVKIIKDGKDIDIPLILGLDMLPRNNLKKLESHKPTIHLITWYESPQSMRYATIIESALGIGIWSNYFADKIYL